MQNVVVLSVVALIMGTLMTWPAKKMFWVQKTLHGLTPTFAQNSLPWSVTRSSGAPKRQIHLGAL